MYFINNIIRFSAFVFILTKGIFLYATEEQCRDSDYTSRCSIIKIIPFDEQPVQMNIDIPMMNYFSAQQMQEFSRRIKTDLKSIISRECFWVSNPVQFVSDSLTQIDETTTVNEYISSCVDTIVHKLNDLREQKRNESIDVSSFTTPDLSVLVKVGESFFQDRLLCGQCSAKQRCGDVEKYGFRRYLRNPKKKSTDRDNFRPSEFNYGRSFVYPTEAELRLIGLPQLYSSDNYHIKITETLARYASGIDVHKNTLFIKISVKSGETLLYDILCGTFLSGSESSIFEDKNPTELVEAPITYKIPQLKELFKDDIDQGLRIVNI